MDHTAYWKRRRPGELPRAPRSRGLAALVPAVLALAVLAAACGSSGASGEGVASAGGAATGKKAADGGARKDPQQAGLDFARCMREHGVDVPDPQVGERGMVMIGPGPGPGADEPVAGQAPPPGFEEAHRACAHLLEDLVQDGDAKVDPEQQDRALRFARCMREHGVDMPDPELSGGGGFSIRIGEGGMDPTSEVFEEARKACGELFGPGAGRPGVGVAGKAAA